MYRSVPLTEQWVRSTGQFQYATSRRTELSRSNVTFITTNAILLEFGNAFSTIHLKPFAIKLINAIMQSKRWKSIEIDQSIMNRGIELFSQMIDKEWGLVDCCSMVVAKDMSIRNIFSTDHHFEQAGFDILLKNPKN
jgi:predicted nucleic acid-binding protein